jgi:hypothetical protein
MLRVYLLLISSIFVSSPSFAECNTVMGGCAKEDSVNVSPHMRSDFLAKTKTVKSVANAPISTNKGKLTNKGKVNTKFASAAQKIHSN